MNIDKGVTESYGFILLLLSLICLLIIPPYWPGEKQDLATGVLLTSVMASFLLLVTNKRWELVVGLVLAVPVLLYNWGGVTNTGSPLYFIITILNVLFYGFITTELMRFLIAKKTVDFNIIAAAICLYFILGLVWTYIYLAIELQTPGAILSSNIEVPAEMFSKLFYFSFVTMTTLGFGDISPVTTIAQRWVLLEAITGQFYLTIVIARLITLYRSEAEQSA